MKKVQIEFDELPFSTLERFGLTREMIEDLPMRVLEDICNGRHSPVLPVRVTDEHGGQIESRSRFAFIRMDDGQVDVVFYPALKSSPLERYDEAQQKQLLGGKSLTVEYARTDGSKVQCTYMHLKEISVKVGDTVQAGGRLGTSGNTGTRTTGEHLHFGVKNIYADGTKRDIDPAAYLAEIAQKGHIKLQMLHNGNDLLVKYKAAEDTVPEKNLSPDGWMKKLLSSEDSGVGISGCNDPIVEMAMTAFASLMLLATQIDNREEEEQKTAISAAMDLRTIDLKPLLPNMKNCDLTIGENGKAILKADNGELHVSRELTASELNRLSATLNNGTLTEEAKQMRVTGMLNTVILSEAASQNFEQGMTRQQGQTENLRR